LVRVHGEADSFEAERVIDNTIGRLTYACPPMNLTHRFPMLPRLALVLAVAVFAMPGHALAQTPTRITPADMVKAAQGVAAFEKARWDATVANDATKLNEMLADDLTYIHSTGYSQTKKEYLASLAAKQLVYHSYGITDTKVQIYGPLAITHGKFAFAALSKGQEVKGEAFYTGVYHEKNGKWQLVSWQTTRITP
jgi:hypothetical protein